MSESRGIMAISLYQKVETEMSKVFFIKIAHHLLFHKNWWLPVQMHYGLHTYTLYKIYIHTGSLLP